MRDKVQKRAPVMVTVCCISYNHKKTITEMLDSILAQKTEYPFEIVIHDDASNDGTRAIIEEYARRYPEKIIPILQTENQYSKGKRPDLLIIPYVNGKYATFCEGDDCWSDCEKLQRQVDALEATPSCSFSVHNVIKRNAKDGKYVGTFPPVSVMEGCLRAEDYIKQELGNDNWMFQISSLMVRSTVLKEYLNEYQDGFMSKFIAGDLPLILYALSRGDAYYIDRNMSIYSVDSGGFMSTLKRNRKFGLRVQQSYIEGLEQYDHYTGERFHAFTEKAILRRRFYQLVCKRDFKNLCFDPAYREIFEEQKPLKKVILKLFAYIPVLPVILDRVLKLTNTEEFI